MFFKKFLLILIMKLNHAYFKLNFLAIQVVTMFAKALKIIMNKLLQPGINHREERKNPLSYNL